MEQVSSASSSEDEDDSYEISENDYLLPSDFTTVTIQQLERWVWLEKRYGKIFPKYQKLKKKANNVKVTD